MFLKKRLTALRVVSSNSAAVWHFEGEKGAERFMREVYPDATVQHSEGEAGARGQCRRLARVFISLARDICLPGPR